MTNTMRIGITGTGAPGTWGTLHALRNNPDEAAISVVGFDANPINGGRYLVDDFHLLPRPSDDGYLDALVHVCKAERLEVLVPQTTAEAAFLALNRRRFDELGIGVVAPPGQAQNLANSKADLTQHAKAAGLQVPTTISCISIADIEAAARTLGYPDEPFVVKPAVSSGSRGFRVVRPGKSSVADFLNQKPDSTQISLESLLEILSQDTFPEILACEHLPGEEYSIDAFRSETRFEAVARRRTAIRTGISSVTDLVDEPDMIEQTRLIAEHMGLTSVFGFQFKEDRNGAFRLLECNPRVQGTMVASLLSGFNFIWAGVCESLGRPIEQQGVTTRHGTYLRYWAGVGVTGQHDVLIR
jgi:carbamoyl-phosphate synthase large subunit